ncbi:TPM domain-containing protein [Pseudanabaena sp. FACHB-2040]|uniref:photosystem II repair protein Psb32 n=1 Tax=Pseudanabaena sp. FACHB-2040 TaxID=2692859 RepID=UPI001689F959|nr:TPM domain-containing protein [Pseudanabaena sp. FACHB-2040]MBD2259964.1 TPM domain-containing protein [Pseudanabaena sp. FACHB-2040]
MKIPYLSIAAMLRPVLILIVTLVAAFGFFGAPANAIATYQLPTVAAGDTTWIVDDANLISRLNEGKISDRLSKLAKETGSEVRLVTIHHFDYGETAQSFTDQLFEQWFPNAEAQANQTLLVLDEVSKTVGIRVGPIVGEQLTPDIATSVAQETVLVPLLEGDKYNESFLEATDRLIAVLSGQPDPGPPAFDDAYDAESTFASAQETTENRSNYTVIVVVLLLLATVIPMATYFFYVGFGN